MMGPTPWISVTVVFDAVTVRVRRRLISRRRSSMCCRSSTRSRASSSRAPATRAVRGDVVEDLDRLCCRDFSGETAGHQLAEHRVQSTHELRARAAQIAVAARPQLHHRGVALDHYLTQITCPQRSHRDRAGVVRVVLVHLPGVEQPHPPGQPAWAARREHVHRRRAIAEPATDPDPAHPRSPTCAAATPPPTAATDRLARALPAPTADRACSRPRPEPPPYAIP